MTTESNRERMDNLVDLILRSKESITAKVAVEQCGFTSLSTLYNAIHYYNRISTSPYRVKSVDGIYIVEPKEHTLSKERSLSKESSLSKEQLFFIDEFLPPSIKVELKYISPTDIPDVMDLLKKAFFYKKSAEALIIASKSANILKDSSI
jgi:hypothetical protein